MMLSSPFPSPLVPSVRTGVLPTCFPRSACLESRRLEGTSRDVTWRGKSCMKPSLILPFPHPPVSACHHCNCMCVCMRWHTTHTHTHTVGGEIILVRDESCRWPGWHCLSLSVLASAVNNNNGGEPWNPGVSPPPTTRPAERGPVT